MSERKLALITGGSRGIGRAVCIALAKKGMDIAFTYSKGAEAAEETIALCREIAAGKTLTAGSSDTVTSNMAADSAAAGTVGEAVIACGSSNEVNIRVRAYQADVTDSDACTELVKMVMEDFGRIDVLVNNAGVTRDGLIMRMNNEDFDTVMNTNARGAFYMMREVSRIMLKSRSGSIVNISSIVGVRGNAGQVNYAASKAAVIGMTKSLARELAGRKINVNAVAPGFIRTDMTMSMKESIRDSIAAGIPFGEMGAPEDVANAVAFLAGDESRYITGQVLCVDGGMAM